MAEKEKNYMPQSTAGLIRYFDVEDGIKLRPHTAVFLSVGFMVLVIVLKFLA
ncbi:MAG: preprotein translocase subunit Sec61beta [Candidatus Aenigmarchaeota archaeon]|nr:preprotein translocase subunit Sec61beta [Candidatus Aenigmarchaeota archaeon]